MILLDVTPHALGIMTFGCYFEELIPQNTTVPTNRAEDLHHEPRQPDGGEDPRHAGRAARRPSENELLGEFILTGLRRAPKGQVEIEVTFEINADGIVSASARRTSRPASEQSIQVTATSGLTRTRSSTMMEDAKDYLVERRIDRGVRGASSKRPRSSSREIEQLFPQVEQIVASSDFGRDAHRARRAASSSKARAGHRARRTSPPSRSRSRGSRARTACSRASWPRRTER